MRSSATASPSRRARANARAAAASRSGLDGAAGVDPPGFATRVGSVVAGEPGVELSSDGVAREVRGYEHRVG